MRMRFVISAAASLLLGVLTSGVAHAQWPCPGGPGPGEVQIGVSGGSHGIAAVPMCAANGAVSSDDFGGGYGGYSPPPPDYFMAVVTHHDTPAVWASTGYLTESGAEHKAMDACTRAMGDGCGVQWYGTNDWFFAVVEDAAGLIFIDGDRSTSGAKVKAMGKCSQVSAGCRQKQIISNGKRANDNFPRGKPPVYRYAVIAWPKDMPAKEWQGKVWLASGVEGYDKAVATAVERCKADTGGDCVRGQHATNGVLVRYVDDMGRIYWVGVANAETAKSVVAKGCDAGRTCRIIDIMKTGDPLTANLTERKSDRPLRGFYSIFWPSKEDAVRPLAIVTAQPTREASDKAAKALCEKESKGPCESLLPEGDWGTEQFIKVLSDSKETTRIEFGYSAAEVTAKMVENCKSDNATCPAGRVIDLTKRESIWAK